MTKLYAHLLKNCQKIHYFGLGFIQIKLSDDIRYHFYHFSLPKIVDDEEVHNHRYNFNSKIIKGDLKQWIYKTIPGTKYVIVSDACNPNAPKLNDTAEFCDIEVTTAQLMSKGTEYFIHRDTYHQVFSDYAITYLHRGKVEKQYAQIIRRADSKPICPFSKVVPENELWAIVEKMCND